MKTLVIGAAIIDIIMKIKRLPKSGEDILCSETVSAVGGCAYNVAGTLRGFDADHDLFVPVGRGMYGNMIAGDLENWIPHPYQGRRVGQWLLPVSGGGGWGAHIHHGQGRGRVL